MMKKLLLLCCLLGAMKIATAQIPYGRTLSGHIELGPSFVNLDNLNGLLTHPDSNYLPFPNTLLAMGFGVDYNTNRWMLGGTLDAYIFSAPGLRIRRKQLALLNYMYLKTRVGYVIHYGNMDRHPFLVFPSVGVGGGFSRLRTNITGGDNFTVNMGWGLLYDIALNLHWFPPIITTESSCIKMGVSIGYMYAPGKNAWNMPNYTNGDRLQVSPQGFYIRLILGMAGGI